MKIDIWSDIACPWCYIGLTRFERALAGFEHAEGVQVVHHSFQLDPTLPESFDGTEAEYLAARKGGSVADMRAMFAHVARAAATEDLTMDFDTLVVANSRRAHRLLHAARDADPTGGVQRRLEDALFRAHFTDGESISDADVLVRLAVAAGMDADLARAALDDPERDAQVAADIARASQLGISGVPFFVLADKYGISGAQPLEAFTQALAQVWDEIHPRVEPLKVPGLEGFSGGQACGPDGC
ncbi:DsbA family oxidoreductase [Propioniciclava coleopterorum]|uniref:DsbA family oxidoreductase n=1 Tax=Propioniciclava coleopterorum TaxID=2714937 RepID=A0A6G7Y3J9_9ACTN|nr:DsbA family oxidoreductase [Propioniciclava coleopterorum]QIK71187.1 DsbA family oxidoreductase [Propioniciclava coleopterorum]